MTDDQQLDATFRTFWIHEDVPDVGRQRQEIIRLPKQLRWSLVRRSPKYVRDWKLAAADSVSEDQLEARQIAKLTMVELFYDGTPVSPETEFKELPVNPGPFDRDAAAIHPITVRALLAWTLSALNYDEIDTVITELLEAKPGHGRSNPDCDVDSIVTPIQWLEEEGLERALPRHCIAIDPHATLDSVMDAVRERWHEVKARQPWDQLRQRAQQVGEYLKVWDSVEGWRDGVYDIARENSLERTSKELELPISTARDRYEQARELILPGYSTEEARELLAVVKIHSSRFAKAQCDETRTFTAVNDKLNWYHEVAALESSGTLKEQLIAAIRRGHSDDEIFKELDLADSRRARQTLQNLRRGITKEKGGSHDLT